MSQDAKSARLMTDEEKRARLFEEQVFPLVGQRLVEHLIAGVTVGPQAQVLQIRCGLGSAISDLLQRTEQSCRIVDLEASPLLVDRARAHVAAEQFGARVLFRPQGQGPLPFDPASFDLVLANVALADLARPEDFHADLFRVARPGAEVRVATLLRGTWLEFIDVYRDVLVRLGREDSLASLRGYASSFPEAGTVARHLEQAGFIEVSARREHWDLMFRSAREFFYAPVIELGPLSRWKAIAGKGAEVQDTFLAVKQAIDTYFAGQPFSVSIEAGVFVAKKPDRSSAIPSREGR
jgi:ubiquinone/menaquinone biosynthesis C-methylase UbiE